jgi:glucose/arabinose dehydrogenase
MHLVRVTVALALAAAAAVPSLPSQAQVTGPSLLVPGLEVEPVVEGLVTPISAAFIGPNDLLVLEKNTGRVRRVVHGEVQEPAVLDLSVNSASERGLLGIALHPDFPEDPGVYLFWSCRSTAVQDADPFAPEEQECSDAAMTGLPDTDDILQVPLLGNRVDRFEWTGTSLVYDRNLVKLLSFQNDGGPLPPGQGDEGQPPRGNHDGGVLAFGPDEKLYVLFGDAGRRGQLQNLPDGPLGDGSDDDQFGGPEPDDAHFTGVILRLNEDGSAPADNPFFAAGGAIEGPAGENIQKVFAYGIRNSFGMAFDRRSGNLWAEENGEDAFDELNLVEPGMNSGWIQVAGPIDRVSQYKEIETTADHHDGGVPNLQQLRWMPNRIADTPTEARARLFMLPGARYSDPEFSWTHVIPPAAVGFVEGRGLGSQFEGDLFVGHALPESHEGGWLFRFNLTGNRRRIAVNDPRLEDRVADNGDFHSLTESESLVVGRDFGVVTDIETGPNGNLFVVSLTRGAVYEISRS